MATGKTPASQLTSGDVDFKKFGGSLLQKHLRLARVKFCDRCGAELISTCPECDYPLKHASDGGDSPRYCRGCGKPYPWTATALRLTKEYADQIQVLSVEEKDELKQSFDDLTMDTPRTPVAASRYKRILTSAGPVAKEILTKTLTAVMTKAAKELLGIKDWATSMYEYYGVKCKALTNGCYCEKSFDLPGSTLLSDDEYENPASEPKWPSSDWKAHLACPKCGSIREYSFTTSTGGTTKNRSFVTSSSTS